MDNTQKNIITKSLISCIFAIIGLILIYQSSKGFVYTRITKSHNTTDALVLTVSNLNIDGQKNNKQYAYQLEYTIKDKKYSAIDTLDKKICDYGQLVTIYYNVSNPKDAKILRVDGLLLYLGLFFLVMTIIFICNFRKINLFSNDSILKTDNVNNTDTYNEDTDTTTDTYNEDTDTTTDTCNEDTDTTTDTCNEDTDTTTDT